MIGKYRITVEDKKVKYDFIIERKYTILCGDSASGKTTLYNMIADPKYNKINVSSIDSSGLPSVDIIAIPKGKKAYIALLKNPDLNKAIYILDETVEDYCTEDFIKLIEQIDAYFIIISRKQIKYSIVSKTGIKKDVHLSYSVNEVYELESSMYNAKYINKFSNYYQNNIIGSTPDIVLTEDSGSGLEILKNVYSSKKEQVVSSCGNRNIINYLREIDKKVNCSLIGVFVDGAAYGDEIGTLLNIMESCRNDVVLYIPESIEWLLLCCIPETEFNLPFNKDVLDRSYMYCDASAFVKLTVNYTSNLPKKVRSWENLYEYYLTYISSKNSSADVYSKGKKVGPLYLRYANKIQDFITNNL